jgi:acetyl-CoA synthetase
MTTVKAPAQANKEEAVDKDQHEQCNKARPELMKKFPVKVNLENYDEVYNSFTWEDAKKEIAYFPGGKMNAAYNAVDRHVLTGRKNKVALYNIDAKNKLEKRTFLEIYEESNRVGNALKKLGVKKGDRVFIFLPRVTGCLARQIER